MQWALLLLLFVHLASTHKPKWSPGRGQHSKEDNDHEDKRLPSWPKPKHKTCDPLCYDKVAGLLINSLESMERRLREHIQQSLKCHSAETTPPECPVETSTTEGPAETTPTEGPVETTPTESPTTPIPVGRDCDELYRAGYDTSKVYKIEPMEASEPFEAFCDMTDGGWTVIVHRFDGSEDFYRPWADYQAGFGSAAGEYWLGLDNIHYLTIQEDYRLRVDFTYYDDTSFYAEYSTFLVEAKDDDYKLSISGFSGSTSHDGLTGSDSHNRQAFSTFDRDNDLWSGGNCAEDLKGGFWYSRACQNFGVPTQLYKEEAAVEAIMWGDKPVKEVTWKVKPNQLTN